MKDIFNKFYKDIILALAYSVVAVIVYVFMAESIWGLWYIDLIMGFGVLVISLVLSYVYVKSRIKEEKKKEETSIQ